MNKIVIVISGSCTMWLAVYSGGKAIFVGDCTHNARKLANWLVDLADGGTPDNWNDKNELDDDALTQEDRAGIDSWQSLPLGADVERMAGRVVSVNGSWVPDPELSAAAKLARLYTEDRDALRRANT